MCMKLVTTMIPNHANRKFGLYKETKKITSVQIRTWTVFCYACEKPINSTFFL